MYQFPLLEVESLKTEEIKSNWENQEKESTEVIHKLSHQTIHAIFHHLDEFPEQPEKNWIKIKMENIQEYPLPRIIDRYLDEDS
jgi:Mn-dependent DtxR family transcriptional regulator